MFCLTNYDTDAFDLFQALFLGVDRQLALFAQSADRYQTGYF
jgi:hypothetical protein